MVPIFYCLFKGLAADPRRGFRANTLKLKAFILHFLIYLQMESVIVSITKGKQMRIEQTFAPITITLEDEFDASMFYALLEHIDPVITAENDEEENAIINLRDQLFNAVKDYA